MSDTSTSGWTCPSCNVFVMHGTFHSCQNLPGMFTLTPRATPMGWECPRCRTIHAPHVNACWCPAPTEYVTNTGTGEGV